MTERRWMILGAVVLGIIVWVTWPRLKPTPAVTPLNVNGLKNVSIKEEQFDRPAPTLTLVDLDGKSVTISSASKQAAVALVFWRTDCETCLDQLTAMSAVPASSGQLYAVNVGQTAAVVTGFLKTHPQTVTVLIDPLRTSDRLYSTTPLPSATFIHHGVVVGFGSGLLTKAALSDKLASIAQLAP